MIAKSLAKSAEECGAGWSWESCRLNYYRALDGGSGYYADLIDEIESRQAFYWSRLQAMA